jgi:hypothetical protein
MKRFMLTVALTLGLSVSVLAGESPTCGIVSIPPAQLVGTMPESDDDATGTSTESRELSGLLVTVILEIITWP